QLAGTKPIELGLLTHLYSLELGGNALISNIPPKLGNLARLHLL
ncbi:unnamed protein product, partial [Ectocarpus sp. 12 AP-2014]